jgi:hypothetical protein
VGLTGRSPVRLLWGVARGVLAVLPFRGSGAPAVGTFQDRAAVRGAVLRAEEHKAQDDHGHAYGQPGEKDEHSRWEILARRAGHQPRVSSCGFFFFFGRGHVQRAAQTSPALRVNCP